MGEILNRQKYNEYIRQVSLTADYIMAITDTSIRPPLWDAPEKDLFKALFLYFSLNEIGKISVLEQVKSFLENTSKEELVEWLCSIDAKHPSAEFAIEPMNKSYMIEEIAAELAARINKYYTSDSYQRFIYVNYTDKDSLLNPEDIPQIMLTQYFG